MTLWTAPANKTTRRGRDPRTGGLRKKGPTVPTALVVDDNYMTSFDLARALDDWGVSAICAGRLDVARRIARETRPALALIDINLAGGFEGLELADEFASLYGSSIIFVTAYSVHDLRRRMRNRSSAILFKPIERESLAAALVATFEAKSRLH